MKETVVIAFPRSFNQAERIATYLNAELLRYEPCIFEKVFGSSRRIIALMSTGIVVRSVAPLLKDKWEDPVVVVVSPNGSYAIPLLGGHHGANELAGELALIGIKPIFTTATEVMGKESVEVIAKKNGMTILNRDSTRLVNAAILDGDIPTYSVSGPAIVIAPPNVSILLKEGEYVVGIGCRKGIHTDEIVDAILKALSSCGISKKDVFVYATTVKKIGESGIVNAIKVLDSNLIFLDDNTVNSQVVHSSSKAKRIGLLGVAEPCALAMSKRKELVMKKTVYGKVTIAIAR